MAISIVLILVKILKEPKWFFNNIYVCMNPCMYPFLFLFLFVIYLLPHFYTAIFLMNLIDKIDKTYTHDKTLTFCSIFKVHVILYTVVFFSPFEVNIITWIHSVPMRYKHYGIPKILINRIAWIIWWYTLIQEHNYSL